MHQWAVTMEQLSNIVGVDVKAGEGPEPVRHLMQAISQAMALEEAGEAVHDVLQRQISQLRVEAASHLSRRNP